MQENYEIFKDLMQTAGLLYLFWRYLKKKKKSSEMKKKNKKKISEDDQSTGHFQSFFSFYFFYFRPPNPKSETKNPINQLIKKIWPYNALSKNLCALSACIMSNTVKVLFELVINPFKNVK